MRDDWRRTALVLAAIALMLFIAFATQRARERAHQVRPNVLPLVR